MMHPQNISSMEPIQLLTVKLQPKEDLGLVSTCDTHYSCSSIPHEYYNDPNHIMGLLIGFLCIDGGLRDLMKAVGLILKSDTHERAAMLLSHAFQTCVWYSKILHTLWYQLYRS